MNCPNCGYPCIKYKQEAGHKKNPKKKSFHRTNFEIVPCPKCGFKGEIRPFEIIEELKPTEVSTKKESPYVLCTKTNQQILKDATCFEFKPKNPTLKARCYNCKFAGDIK